MTPPAVPVVVRVTRVIEYEGTHEDVERMLQASILTAQPVILPGDVVPGFGLLMGHRDAPKVTLRLIEETWS